MQRNCNESSLYYTHGITPNRVTSGGVYLRGLAPDSTAMASRFRHCARFDRLGIEPKTSRTDCDVVNKYADKRNE